MEEEFMISGYCRTLDESRMVTVERTDGVITEVDCCYGHCLYEPSCTVAARILELEKHE